MSTGLIVLITLLAAIISGAIGFVIGRKRAPGGEAEVKKLIGDYEEQLLQKQNEIDTYQQMVHEHYDKTAGLFKDMAGSYKNLFDHLSTGYEQLGNYSDKRVLPERAGALLDGPDTEPHVNDFMNPKDSDEDALK
jgi:hypothetical protein